MSIDLPIVSIMIPRRGEERFIGGCLVTIIENAFPKEKLGVPVIDGISEDGTPFVVGRHSEKHPYKLIAF